MPHAPVPPALRAPKRLPTDRCPVCRDELLRWGRDTVCAGCPLPIRLPDPPPPAAPAALRRAA